MIVLRKTSIIALVFFCLLRVIFYTSLQSAQAGRISTEPIPEKYSIGQRSPDGITEPTLSPPAQKQLNEKDKLAQQNWSRTHVASADGMSPNTYLSKSLNVLSSGYYTEPNDPAHTNYCVPTASRVAIKGHGSSVPGIEVIATQEGVAPGNNWVYLSAAVPVLNQYVNQTYYVEGYSSGTAQFAYWLEYDINLNFSMLTALYTQGIAGWNVYADHVVATYGYVDNNGTVSVFYVDTGSNAAGYYGGYFNSPYLSDFYPHVTADGQNAQVW